MTQESICISHINCVNNIYAHISAYIYAHIHMYVQIQIGLRRSVILSTSNILFFAIVWNKNELKFGKYWIFKNNMSSHCLHYFSRFSCWIHQKTLPRTSIDIFSIQWKYVTFSTFSCQKIMQQQRHSFDFCVCSFCWCCRKCVHFFSIFLFVHKKVIRSIVQYREK